MVLNEESANRLTISITNFAPKIGQYKVTSFLAPFLASYCYVNQKHSLLTNLLAHARLKIQGNFLPCLVTEVCSYNCIWQHHISTIKCMHESTNAKNSMYFIKTCFVSKNIA